MKRGGVAVVSRSTSDSLVSSLDDAMTASPSSSAAIGACWSCKGPVAGRALFCSVCGAVQGPGNSDHFQRLALPASFDIDPDALQRQYFGFQRRLHPDRFAAKSPTERALSQAQATALNEAYEALRDPLKRAVHLLERVGHAVDLHSAATITDPVLLGEQMERREVMEAANTPDAIKDVLVQADHELASCRDTLSRAFAAEDWPEAARLVVRLKYLTKLADEARAKKARMARGL